jgi:hypothetical protein
MKFDDLFNEWKGGKYGYPAGAHGARQSAMDGKRETASQEDNLISTGVEQGREAAEVDMSEAMAWIQDQLQQYNIDLNSDPEIIRLSAIDKDKALVIKQQKLDNMENQLMGQYLS